MRAKLNRRTVAALRPAEAPYDVRDTAISGFLMADTATKPSLARRPQGVVLPVPHGAGETDTDQAR